MKLLLLFTLMLGIARGQNHSHFAAGVIDANDNSLPDPGEALQFVGDDGSSRVFHLLPRPVGHFPVQHCGGYYVLDERPRTDFPNDTFSIIALSDGQYEIVHPIHVHAHTGAWIWMEIVAVSGPPGGNFGFWDENQSYFSDVPTATFSAGEPTGNFGFVVSEGSDDPSEDPSGHIHNRSWTADKAGSYFVSFRLTDRSTSGPGGGPWHAPSRIYTWHFKAGPDFTPVISLGSGGAVLTWSSLMGINDTTGQQGIRFYVERHGPDGWETLGSVLGTTAPTATFADPESPAGSAIYRLSYGWATP